MKKEKAPTFEYAERYHNYALKYDVYKTSIKRLVDWYDESKRIPKRILDLACGSGMTVSHLVSRYPAAEIVCTDNSKEMITIAKKENQSCQGIKYAVSRAEELSAKNLGVFDVVFCNAAFWYFDCDVALANISKVLESDGYLVFNISEPAISFEDDKYDDRFLQTMVEVLDDKGIIFHRVEGVFAKRLKLSYEPPKIKAVITSLKESGFKNAESNVWKFTKSLEELAEFYMIPGFGTKAFRELTDENLKKEIILEIVARLKEQGIGEINYRWVEFRAQKH